MSHRRHHKQNKQKLQTHGIKLNLSWIVPVLLLWFTGNHIWNNANSIYLGLNSYSFQPVTVNIVSVSNGLKKNSIRYSYYNFIQHRISRGNRYQGEQTSPPDNEYQAGQFSTAYYNPVNPSEIVLKQGVPIIDIASLTFFIVLGLFPFLKILNIVKNADWYKSLQSKLSEIKAHPQ